MPRLAHASAATLLERGTHARSPATTQLRTALAQPSIVPSELATRKPRTSLIDAEWEWLAQQAEVKSSRAASSGPEEPSFDWQPPLHTKTLPPPPFVPLQSSQVTEPPSDASRPLETALPLGPAPRRSRALNTALSLFVAAALLGAGFASFHRAAAGAERAELEGVAALAGARLPEPASSPERQNEAAAASPAPLSAMPRTAINTARAAEPAAVRQEAPTPFVRARSQSAGSKAPPKVGSVSKLRKLAVARLRAANQAPAGAHGSDNPY